MPADNLGQTFRFIVEQAGGGGGGTAGSTGGGGGRGDGAAGRANRDANEFRNMMTKMVKAVDHSEKTTQSAFTKGFKSLGIQLTLGNMLKQSQIFTGTLNAIFQVIGALVDIVLAPFMPLIVKFLQKAIPRLLDFAERMANWVRGELALLDELGLMGYIRDKLTTVMTEGLGESYERFGKIVSKAMGTITETVVAAIPSIIGIALRALGTVLSEVVGTAITEIGLLLSDSIGGVIIWVSELVASAFNKAGAGGVADWIREKGTAAGEGIKAMGEMIFKPLGESATSLIKWLTDGAADLLDSDLVNDVVSTFATSLGNFVETGLDAGLLAANDAAMSLATTITEYLEPALKKPKGSNQGGRNPFVGFEGETDSYLGQGMPQDLDPATGTPGTTGWTGTKKKKPGMKLPDWMTGKYGATDAYMQGFTASIPDHLKPPSWSGGKEPPATGGFNYGAYWQPGTGTLGGGVPGTGGGQKWWKGQGWDLIPGDHGGSWDLSMDSVMGGLLTISEIMSKSNLDMSGGDMGMMSLEDHHRLFGSDIDLTITTDGQKQDVEKIVDGKNNTKTSYKIDLDRYAIEEAGGWMT